MHDPTAVDTFRLDLPNPWQILPVDPAELDETLARLRELDAWKTLDVARRREAELTLRRFASDARAGGVRLAAFHADLEQPTTADDAAELTLATLVSSVLTSADMGTDLPLTPHVLLAALTMQRSDEPVLTTTRVRGLAPPAIEQLPYGAVVRSRRIRDHLAKDAEPLTTYVDTFYAPVPAAPHRMVLLEFSTPHVDAIELFAEYFGAVASTLRFYRQDEATAL